MGGISLNQLDSSINNMAAMDTITEEIIDSEKFINLFQVEDEIPF